MQVQVLRPFSAATPVRIGEIIDASDWPVNRMRQLTRFRYVQPFVATSPATAKSPGARKAEA